MNRRWPLLAIAVCVVAIGPVPLPAQPRSRCPVNIQIQRWQEQQQAIRIQQEQIRQQQIQIEQRQQRQYQEMQRQQVQIKARSVPAPAVRAPVLAKPRPINLVVNIRTPPIPRPPITLIRERTINVAQRPVVGIGGGNRPAIVPAQRTITTAQRIPQAPLPGRQINLAVRLQPNPATRTVHQAPPRQIHQATSRASLTQVARSREELLVKATTRDLLLNRTIVERQNRHGMTVTLNFNCVQCHRTMNQPPSPLTRPQAPLPNPLVRLQPRPPNPMTAPPQRPTFPNIIRQTSWPVTIPKPRVNPLPPYRPNWPVVIGPGPVLPPALTPLRNPFWVGIPQVPPRPADFFNPLVPAKPLEPSTSLASLMAAKNPQDFLRAISKEKPSVEGKSPLPVSPGPPPKAKNPDTVLALFSPVPKPFARDGSFDLVDVVTTPATEKTAAREKSPARGDLDRPSLPPLPASVWLLNSHSKEAEEVAPSPGQGPLRGLEALSRPVLPPVPTHILVPF